MFSTLRRTMFGTGHDQRAALACFDPYRPTDLDERQQRFMNAAEALYWQAERSRDRARSYRNFCVSCGVFAHHPGLSLLGGRFRASYGFNSKSGPNERNICAEPVAIDTLAAIGYEEVVGLVVVGETQEDERGVTQPTLRPCRHCRLFMRTNPLIKPHTLIITANPPPHPEAEWSEIVHETWTLESLCAAYGEALT